MNFYDKSHAKFGSKFRKLAVRIGALPAGYGDKTLPVQIQERERIMLWRSQADELGNRIGHGEKSKLRELSPSINGSCLFLCGRSRTRAFPNTVLAPRRYCDPCP